METNNPHFALLNQNGLIDDNGNVPQIVKDTLLSAQNFVGNAITLRSPFKENVTPRLAP